MITECGFDMAWGGKCTKPTENGQRCEGHRGMKCASCGVDATSLCAETMGPFCCGEPLCGGCEHTIGSRGTNSPADLPAGMGMHCRKGSQVYKGWYEEGAEEHNARVLSDAKRR